MGFKKWSVYLIYLETLYYLLNRLHEIGWVNEYLSKYMLSIKYYNILILFLFYII